MNKVFIATSLDGFISDRNGKIDWLNSIPNPSENDMGYKEFYSQIDALLMGRNTFETILGFDIEWPYDKPVFVLSNSLNSIPKIIDDKVFLVRGELKSIIHTINNKGYKNLYIDGGNTIQSLLNEDLIDELTITTFPLLLGGGAKLFTSIPNQLNFELIKTTTFLDQITQNTYSRKRENKI